MNQSKIYNIDKKFCFRVSLAYFASVLFANFMAQLIPVCVDFPVAHTDDMLKWKSFLDSNEILVMASLCSCEKDTWIFSSASLSFKNSLKIGDASTINTLFIAFLLYMYLMYFTRFL